jgi:hypothetical protein
MSELTHEQLLAKYGVPGMGDYTAPGGPAPQILERLDATGSLPVEALQFLKDKGLFELCTCVGRLMSTGRADFGILRARVERRDRLLDERMLRERYQIVHFEHEDKRRLLGILRAIESGQRLRDEDVVWLEERDLFSDALRRDFHEHEGKYHRTQFQEGGDPWEAVNASSHFRKAGLASDAFARSPRRRHSGRQHWRF